MAGLAFLHFWHHYKRNKPQVACKLQEDEIHMRKPILVIPQNISLKENYPANSQTREY